MFTSKFYRTWVLPTRALGQPKNHEGGGTMASHGISVSSTTRYTRQLLQFVFLACLSFGQTLPNLWVDNNEAIDGSVHSYTITDPGRTTCTPATGGTLTISLPTSGTPATAVYTCSGGNTLSGVTITNPGSGYTSSPAVTGFSGTCTGCAVTLMSYTPPAYELQLGGSTCSGNPCGTWITGPRS